MGRIIKDALIEGAGAGHVGDGVAGEGDFGDFHQGDGFGILQWRVDFRGWQQGVLTTLCQEAPGWWPQGSTVLLCGGAGECGDLRAQSAWGDGLDIAAEGEDPA